MLSSEYGTAHIRQSKLNFGRVFHVKVLSDLKLFPLRSEANRSLRRENFLRSGRCGTSWACVREKKRERLNEVGLRELLCSGQGVRTRQQRSLWL